MLSNLPWKPYFLHVLGITTCKSRAKLYTSQFTFCKCLLCSSIRDWRSKIRELPCTYIIIESCKQASLIVAFRIIGVLFWSINGKPRPADFHSVILIVSWVLLSSLLLVVSNHLSCFDWFMISSFVLVILAVSCLFWPYCMLLCYAFVQWFSITITGSLTSFWLFL